MPLLLAPISNPCWTDPPGNHPTDTSKFTSAFHHLLTLPFAKITPAHNLRLGSPQPRCPAFHISMRSACFSLCLHSILATILCTQSIIIICLCVCLTPPRVWSLSGQGLCLSNLCIPSF